MSTSRLLIRHEGAPSSFVANLAKALGLDAKKRGVVLEVAIEATIPGGLRGFLDQEVLTLLVVAEKDLESGWFRENYEMGSTTTRVAFFGSVDRGIVEAYGGLCFSKERGSSLRALSGLSHQIHGSEPPEAAQSTEGERLRPEDYEVDPDPSQATEDSFYQQVFRQLDTTPTLILLAQAGRGERAFVEQFQTRAITHYGEENVLDLRLPSSLDLTPLEMFVELGRACGFGRIERQLDWEIALKERLEENRVLLLISRFEHATRENQRALGKVIRGLSEETRQSALNTVVSGGEGLAELKYIVADHSFLDNAGSLPYPDLSVSDLVEWAQRDAGQVALTEEDAGKLIERYGGHPGLLRQALGVLRRLADRDPETRFAAIREEESAYRWFAPYFLPFRKDAETKKRVCDFLRHPEKLGRFSLWHDDPVIHRLFWGNLLRQEETLFEWRSPVVVEAGLEILGCASG